jgi:hypothetical protein
LIRSKIIATSLQNNSRKRKICFSLYLQIINVLKQVTGGFKLISNGAAQVLASSKNDGDRATDV